MSYSDPPWHRPLGKFLQFKRYRKVILRWNVKRLSRGPNDESMLDYWAPRNVLPVMVGVRIMWRHWYVIVRWR